jgi:hypothetical protein
MYAAAILSSYILQKINKLKLDKNNSIDKSYIFLKDQLSYITSRLYCEMAAESRKFNQKRPLLDNGAVNTFPLQRINAQQKCV